MKKRLSSYELIEYAKDNGFDSLEFEIIYKGDRHKAKFLDAYFGFVSIPSMNINGMFSLNDVPSNFEFEIEI